MRTTTNGASNEIFDEPLVTESGDSQLLIFKVCVCGRWTHGFLFLRLSSDNLDDYSSPGVTQRPNTWQVKR